MQRGDIAAPHLKLLSLGVAVATVVLLLLPAAATAKDFRPGDLRICDARRCVPIVDSRVLPTLSAFYYTGKQPRRAGPPRLGARVFKLEFPNGYVTGIVAASRLDRFLSYGVNLGRFRAGAWYRLPARAAASLRALALRLRPLRLTRALVSQSR